MPVVSVLDKESYMTDIAKIQIPTVNEYPSSFLDGQPLEQGSHEQLLEAIRIITWKFWIADTDGLIRITGPRVNFGSWCT